MKDPKYSICITHYNNAKTIRASLESILSQINECFEVLVVDALSTDGSREILRAYAASGRIKLVEARCSRGLGREIAFRNSSGQYVIANLDMDCVFKPVLVEMLRAYHEKAEGFVLHVVSHSLPQDVTIAPHSLLSFLGGWMDLQYGEDWDLWFRAWKEGKYRWTVLQVIDQANEHVERATFLGLAKLRYTMYRDWTRLGREVFSPGEPVTAMQYVLYGVAKVAAVFHTPYLHPLSKKFKPCDQSYYVQLAPLKD